MVNYVVIPAAGQGRRMESKKSKQLIKYKGYPILYHTLLAFQKHKGIHGIVLVVRQEEKEYIEKEIVHRYSFDKVQALVVGGDTRQESVYNGLTVLEGPGHVLVHDGARPMVTEAVISRLLDKLNHCQAVICGVPVKDTIKKVTQDHLVEGTLDRKHLLAVQTPQAFDLDLLKAVSWEGLEKKVQVTDDAMLVERFSQVPVHVVKGSYRNIKVTTKEDLAMLE